MKADSTLWLAAAIGIVLGLIVGGWNGPPFGKDGAVQYAHEDHTPAKR